MHELLIQPPGQEQDWHPASKKEVSGGLWQVEQVSLETHRAQIVAVIEECKLSTDYIDQGEVWLVIKHQGEVVGCITIETRGELVHIQSFSVQKNMRKKGIARALVDAVYKDFVQTGQTLIAMTLFWNNVIYKALGFEHLSPKLKQADDVGSRVKHKYCTVLGKKK